tara:strand:+ start:175 stop:954 length:780 start_codon:yes stop_codon:yes gene_type:complete
MKIHQIDTQSVLDNFTYLLELGDGNAIAIDPWDDVITNELLAVNNLSLKAIINTHEHWDHIQGNEPLVAQHGCEVWAHANGEGKIPGLSRILTAGELITLDNAVALKVLDTPGHTMAHLCFLVLEQGAAKAVFTGDTLFNAGIGHCRSGGDVDVLYDTIVQQFHSLEDSIIIYPGHKYLENNLRFTLSIEPDNQDAQNWLAHAIEDHDPVNPITTTIGDERKFNAFFRLASSEIRARLNCELGTDREVFTALRARRDGW